MRMDVRLWCRVLSGQPTVKENRVPEAEFVMLAASVKRPELGCAEVPIQQRSKTPQNAPGQAGRPTNATGIHLCVHV